MIVGGTTSADERADELKRVVNRNTGYAHMTRGVNMYTLIALKSCVTESDIPVLTHMLDDRDHVMQLAAAGVLVDLGAAGQRALEGARVRATDVRTRSVIDDALHEARSPDRRPLKDYPRRARARKSIRGSGPKRCRPRHSMTRLSAFWLCGSAKPRNALLHDALEALSQRGQVGEEGEKGAPLHDEHVEVRQGPDGRDPRGGSNQRHLPEELARPQPCNHGVAGSRPILDHFDLAADDHVDLIPGLSLTEDDGARFEVLPGDTLTGHDDDHDVAQDREDEQELGVYEEQHRQRGQLDHGDDRDERVDRGQSDRDEQDRPFGLLTPGLEGSDDPPHPVLPAPTRFVGWGGWAGVWQLMQEVCPDLSSSASATWDSSCSNRFAPAWQCVQLMFA